MINRLELYGVIGLVLLAVLLGAYFKGSHDGYQRSEDRSAKALLIAQAKADAASAKSLQISQDSAQQIETIRTQHEQELDAVRGSLLNRLCRPTPNRLPVPAVSAPAPKPDATEQGRPDAGRAPVDLVGLVAACQSDSDTLTALQGWVRAQQE